MLQIVWSFVGRYVKNERGVTAIEYGLIAALIAIVIITAVSSAGDSLQSLFERVANELTTALSS